MALACIEHLTFAYPSARALALDDVSLRVDPGETIAVLGPSGSGKSTLLRALAGLVPHFHGGTFAGRVVVAGYDTRRARPADLAGTVASVFQDPEDQIVMAAVANEIAFGLANTGVAADLISGRVESALGAVGAVHLLDRRTAELSGGELQRVCLAAALALDPDLLLLDEPTSQLDPPAAEEFLRVVRDLGITVVLSEQRTARALELADRVLFLENGQVLLDAPCEPALDWLLHNRPAFFPSLFPGGHVPVPGTGTCGTGACPGEPVLQVQAAGFGYGGMPVLDGVDLEVRRGEVVTLEGPNGSGKTTLAKLACGLLDPGAGAVRRTGRACYLSQDPGRYLVKHRADEEVALAVGGDLARARRALATVGLEELASRHPRDLSSGERERLGLAAVSVAEPDLLVLDEPTRGVDPERRRALESWLLEYAAAGRGVLVATHDRSFRCHRRVTLGSREPARV